MTLLACSLAGNLCCVVLDMLLITDSKVKGEQMKWLILLKPSTRINFGQDRIQGIAE
jgi:hypothetical protein